MVRYHDKDVEIAIDIIKDQPKTNDDFEYLSKFLSQFEDIGDCMRNNHKTHRNQIIRCLKVETCSPGMVILKKGNPCENYYIFVQGKIQYFDEQLDGNLSFVKSLKPGKTVGIINRKIGQIMEYTYKCITKCTFLTLSADEFKQLISEEAFSILHEKIVFIDKYFPKIRNVTSYHRDRIAYALIIVESTRGHILLHEGDTNSDLYFIRDGQLAVNSDNNSNISQIVKLEPGNCFGEESSLLGQSNKYTIVVSSEFAKIYIIKKEFLSLIPEETKDALKINFTIKEFGRNRLVGLNSKNKLKSKNLSPIIDIKKCNFPSASTLGKKNLFLISQRLELDSLYEFPKKISADSFNSHKKILLQLRNDMHHRSPRAIGSPRSPLAFKLNSLSKSFEKRASTAYGGSLSSRAL